MPSHKFPLAVFFLAHISASIAAFQDGSPRSTTSADRQVHAPIVIKKYGSSISRSPTYSPITTSSNEEEDMIMDTYAMYDSADLAQKRRRRVALVERRLNSPTRIQNESLREGASRRHIIQPSEIAAQKRKTEELDEKEKLNQLIHISGLRACISRSPTYTPHENDMDEHQESMEPYIYQWPTPSPRSSRMPSVSKSPTFYGTDELDNNNDSRRNSSPQVSNESSVEQISMDKSEEEHIHNIDTRQTISHEEEILVSKENDHLVTINNTKFNYNPVTSETQNTVFQLGEEEASFDDLESPSQYPSTISDGRKEHSRSSLFSSFLQHEARSDM